MRFRLVAVLALLALIAPAGAAIALPAPCAGGVLQSHCPCARTDTEPSPTPSMHRMCCCDLDHPASRQVAPTPATSPPTPRLAAAPPIVALPARVTPPRPAPAASRRRPRPPPAPARPLVAQKIALLC
jgi:hypothetical protein